MLAVKWQAYFCVLKRVSGENRLKEKLEINLLATKIDYFFFKIIRFALAMKTIIFWKALKLENNAVNSLK